jgi:phage-related protein
LLGRSIRQKCELRGTEIGYYTGISVIVSKNCTPLIPVFALISSKTDSDLNQKNESIHDYLLILYRNNDTFSSMKEYIAYKGHFLTIEWFFDESGNSDALSFFENLSNSQKRKTLMLFKRIGDSGKIFDITKFRNEGDQIFAFKPQPDRFLSFFYTGKKIIVTNGFCKKTKKLPKNEKETALKRMKSYESRVTKGDYYEE